MAIFYTNYHLASRGIRYSDGLELEPETKYWVVLDVREDIPDDDECELRRTEDNRQTGRSGWTIGDSGRRRAWDATSWTNDDRSRSMVITLNGDEWASAPKNLRVIEKSHAQVLLHWDMPDILGDPQLTHYFVESKEIVGWVNHEWVEIGRTEGFDTTGFFHLDAEPYTQYTYRVRGGRVGQPIKGLPSNEVTVRTDRVPSDIGVSGSIWSGTITVGENPHFAQSTGYVRPGHFTEGYGSASDATFTLHGEDYVITGLIHQGDTDRMALFVDEWHRRGAIRDLILEVGTSAWGSADDPEIEDDDEDVLSWREPTIPWSVGDTVAVRLRAEFASQPPEFASPANGFYQCLMEENPNPGLPVCDSYHPKSATHGSKWMDSATDPEGTSVAYSLEGRDADKFIIDPVSGNVTTKAGVTYDYETQQSCRFEGQTYNKCLELTLKATDPGGLSDTQEAIVRLEPGFEIRSLNVGTWLRNGHVVHPEVTLNWDSPRSGGHSTKLKDFEIQYYDTDSPDNYVRETGIDGRNGRLRYSMAFGKEYMVRVVVSHVVS